MAEKKTSPRRVKAVQRQADAIKLRTASASFQEIADELGYASPSGAFEAVKAGLQATLQEPAEEHRTLALLRLDDLRASVWHAALEGNLGAVETALRIEERSARLLGLDAPKTSTVSVQQGKPSLLDMMREAQNENDAEDMAALEEAERDKR